MKNILTALTLSCLVTFAYSADMTLPIRGVADGDTIRSTLSLPCPLCNVSIRIRGIDTPESNHLAKCPAEKLKGIAAKDFLKTVLANEPTMLAKNVKWDKYGGRIDAEVVVNGMDIGKLMITKGLAKPYTGQGPKSNWCD
jgi:endonuclease YncB( thermonuclease family)